MKLLIFSTMTFVMVLFITTSCENSSAVDELNIHVSNFKIPISKFVFQKSNLKHSQILLSLSDSIGNINKNIPIKQIDKYNFSLITDKQFVVLFKIDTIATVLKEFKIPDQNMSVQDYVVDSDTTVLFIWGQQSSIISRYNFFSRKSTVLKHYKYSSRFNEPYLGLTITKLNDNLVFSPSNNESNSNSPFSIYKNDLTYIKTIGNIVFDDEKLLAPSFESPILTDIVNNTFYLTFSGSNLISKYNITKELKFELISQINLPKIPANGQTKSIDKTKLDDFDYLTEKYLSSSYILRILSKSNYLYRITKQSQTTVNSKTRKLNTLLDASWVIEKFDFKTMLFSKFKVTEGNFIYTQSFFYNNSLYFLRNNLLTDSNDLIFKTII